MDFLAADEVGVLAQGRIIETIKMVRVRTGLGLREAKQLVDRYAAALGMMREEVCMGCNGTGKVYVRNPQYRF